MNPFNPHTPSTGQKILPIFNMRKRPRQALYAVPSSQESIKDVLHSNTTSFRKPVSQEKQQRSTLLQRNDSDTSAQCKGNWKRVSSSVTASSNSLDQPLAVKPKPQPNQFDQIPTRKHPPMQLLLNSNKVKPTKSRWPHNQNAMKTSALPTRNSAQTVSAQTFQKPQRTESLEKPSCNYPIKKVTNFQPDVRFSIQDSFSSGRVETTNKKLKRKETTTGSLRVLTLGVEGVKKWSQVLSDEMLMFEVFGLLNSEVTFNSEGTAKKFTLKDGNHTMQCIFYETDRIMPLLKRGQWIRCAGIFLNNITIFQCVSVREVTQNEQRWMKAQVGACEKALKSYASVLKMEP